MRMGEKLIRNSRKQSIRKVGEGVYVHIYIYIYIYIYEEWSDIKKKNSNNPPKKLNIIL